VEALMFFLNNSFGLQESVRYRQDVGQRALEIFQEEQAVFSVLVSSAL
jgi:hypothetical protein